MTSKETYKQQLEVTEKAIKKVETAYIKALQSIGYEYIDNTAYTNKLDSLLLKKDKLYYLLCLE